MISQNVQPPARAGRATYGFIVTMADEGPGQLEACLGFLRAAYPDIPAAVISDGVSHPDYPVVCERHRVAYVEGGYLKRVECGGSWWRRLLTHGVGMDVDWIVKIDPDTRVWRPFRFAPPYSISGTLKGAETEFENIQGGCQAISVAAARKILASELLDSPVLRNAKSFARDDADYRQLHALAYFSTDKSLVWLARNLGIDQGEWSEVGSNWKPPAPANGDRRYAVTHPHKLTLGPRLREAPLRVIVTCKGRLDHLKQTLPLFLAEPGVAVTVVDYDCPQGTADWVAVNHPEVTIVRLKGEPKFNLSKARNLGARHSPPGWWCFFDADAVLAPGWAAAIRENLRERYYLLASPIEWGQFGSVVVHSSDYHAVGGYDELFRAWGWEDGDFYARLRHVGCRPGSFPGKFLSSIPHSEATRTAFYDVKQVRISREFYARYVRRKIQFMLQVGRLPTRAECLAFLAEVALLFELGDVDAFYVGVEDGELDIEVIVNVPVMAKKPGQASSLRFSASSMSEGRERSAGRSTLSDRFGREAAKVSENHDKAEAEAEVGVETQAVEPEGEARPPGDTTKTFSVSANEADVVSRDAGDTPRQRNTPVTAIVDGGDFAPPAAHRLSTVAHPVAYPVDGHVGDEPLNSRGSVMPGVVPITNQAPTAPLPRAVPLPAETAKVIRPMITISLINHSTHDLGVTLEELAKIGTEFLAILDKFWPGKAARVVPAKVIMPGTRAVVLVDHSDQASALGYHTLSPDGQPVGQVAVLDTLTNGHSVAEVLTHELAEMQVDPFLNLEAVSAAGVTYAYEVSDAVENAGFLLRGQRVSNFVTPAWFEADRAPGSAQFDYLRTVSAPFTLAPGGYAAVIQHGQWTQIFGSVETQQTVKAKPLGRFARRRAKSARQQTHMHAAYHGVDHRAATR